MKSLYILIIALAVVACSKSEHSGHEGHNMSTEPDSTNTILYNQVMDIHDEVMPKMQDLHNVKTELQAKLATATAEEKAALEKRIAKLDSAGNLMMDWMHEFNPPADTADQEQSRAYYESELEKVKKMRDVVNETLKAEGKN